MFIAVDIGNSRIKFGLFHERPDSDITPPQPDAVFSDFDDLEKALPDSGRPIEWSVSCVNHRNLAEFQARLNRFRKPGNPGDTLEILGHDDVPMELAPEPRTLGIDRLLAAFAGWRIFGKGPLMLADFGTAITVDLVSESGRFEGGAILPGLRTAAKSLHDATESLPFIEISGCEFPEYPGRNTREAIICGIFGSAIGAIGFYLESAREQCGKEIPLIVSGGDAEFGRLIGNFIKSPIFFEPNLVLRGISVCGKKTGINRRSTDKQIRARSVSE